MGEAILKRDTNFRNFLLADAFTLMSMSASAFYAVYAIEKFDVPASYAGTFTVIVMAGMVAGNSVFGYLADSFGHKMNLIALASVLGGGKRTSPFSQETSSYMDLLFSLCHGRLDCKVISRLSFVVELCSEAERQTYIALTNTITAPTVAVGILFGWLARAYGFQIMFALAAFIGLSAAAWLYFFVTDPRIGDARDDGGRKHAARVKHRTY